MSSSCLFTFLRRALLVFSVALSGCALHPAKESETSNRTEAISGDTTTADWPDVLDVDIGEEDSEPLPVVLLKSDPTEEDFTNAVQDHDIWQRVRDGFSLPTVDDNLRVRHYLSWHQSQPDYLHRVTGRAEPYLYFILEEIERRRLPTELVLLPVIESAYIPFAYSRSHASGLWQFIPDTGRLYGLKQSWWYDGRRDVHASTLAALDYLETLSELFEGDWFHALAAYNAGPGKVLREIEKNRRLGKPSDYWHLDLPNETRNYVPKLLAVKTLVQDPTVFGIKLWPVTDEPYLTSVDIESQIDLILAAKLADMEAEPFQLLNPGFSRWATDPDGPHRLLLPIDRVEGFKQQVAELPSSERVTWLRHEIKSGETLSHIAGRYGTTVSLLQQTNGLRGGTIRAGNYLLVPQATLGISTFTTTQSGASRQLGYERGKSHTHTVRRGESLWSISRNYAVTVNELISWNGRESSGIIRPGDQLVIRGEPARSELSPTTKALKYSVQHGDSLYAIARRFDVSIADLCRWNNIHDETLLHPGQAMTLYLSAAEFGDEG